MKQQLEHAGNTGGSTTPPTMPPTIGIDVLTSEWWNDARL